MIKFGSSGTGDQFASECNCERTVEVPAWLKTKNLDCYEYSFGRGARITEKCARDIGAAFKNESIEISVHAPYFINLACEDEKVEANIVYFMSTLKRLEWMGGKRCIFHPGTQMKMTREEALAKAASRLDIVLSKIYDAGYCDCMLAIESMGKISQLGDVEEVIELVKHDKMLYPGIDFGHLNSRWLGGIKSQDDYRRIIDRLIDALGYEKVRDMHIHFSKQEYSSRGEVRHLTFADETYGPDYEPLAELLYEYKLEPYVICESAGTQVLDAVIMKDIYYSIVNTAE